MKIIITSEKLIKDIQDEFNMVFPFLRIEFFMKSNRKSKETVDKISNLLTIGNAYKIKEPKKIEISPFMTVKDLGKDFEKQFGTTIQLYRKLGNLWLEITFTDTWTMKQQDDRGHEISNIIKRYSH